jgi:hypothetical protein
MENQYFNESCQADIEAIAERKRKYGVSAE